MLLCKSYCETTVSVRVRMKKFYKDSYVKEKIWYDYRDLYYVLSSLAIRSMRLKKYSFYAIIIALYLTLFAFGCNEKEDLCITKIVDLKKEAIIMYWKDEQGNIIHNFDSLYRFTESKSEHLIFAMNGGMFRKDYSPLGLYIENHKTIRTIDTGTGDGNFYLKPNGVFLITSDDKGVVCETDSFRLYKNIKYATQSGPMLLNAGTIHSAFNKNSLSTYIRNGVGILPDGNIVFAISKSEINLYNFAQFFKQMGCVNALYLDGFVSKVFYPVKNIFRKDGKLGVLIGVIKYK